MDGIHPKIVFLVRSLEIGGAERQLSALANRLYSMGENVAVVVFYPGGVLENELRDAGLVVYSLGKRGRWDLLGFGARLVRLLRRLKPDVLIGFLGGANILTAVVRPFVPGMKVICTLSASYMDLSHYDWLSKLTYYVEMKAAKRADRVIANSHAGLEAAVRRGVPEDLIAVIPNGIDLDRFRPDLVGGKRVRAEWGVANDEILIGLVARLDPMKDHETFLRATALVLQRRSDVRFVCVGTGDSTYTDHITRLSTELGLEERLIWAGYRGDMAAVYSALDIACLSSYGEGSPNTVGEAMAAGVPCVVTDVGDAARIVGELGEVVPARNPVALAAGMEAMMARVENEGNTINRRVRESILSRFAVESKGEQIMDIIHDVVQDRAVTSCVPSK